MRRQRLTGLFYLNSLNIWLFKMSLTHPVLPTANPILRAPAPAKLNLFLHITGRRADGYHELQTLFQLIDLCDELSFYPRQDGLIVVDGLADVPLEHNLIYRAALLLKPHAKAFIGLNIQLHKNIPMGAGLGGGSSDAATTLLVLNQLWRCELSLQQLAALGLQLGADVPVFVYGENAWAEGVGEKLEFVTLPSQHFIVLKPDCFISTHALFSQKLLTRDSKPSTFCAYQTNPSAFGNNFAALAQQLYPEVDAAMQYLNQFGTAKLTGTGACVFVACHPQMDVNKILANAPCQAYAVNSLNRSPIFDVITAL